MALRRTWRIPTTLSSLQIEEELRKALDLISQSIHDLKALDNAGIINKEIFQGFDFSIEEKQNFINKFKP